MRHSERYNHRPTDESADDVQEGKIVIPLLRRGCIAMQLP